MNMHNAQLEMSFQGATRVLSRRQRRLSRAQWWFQRMRQIVDRAIEWQPSPPARPEQIWFPGASGQAGFMPGSRRP
jgi:hypothetical protein